MLPYLIDFTGEETTINPRKFVTEDSRKKFIFAKDYDPPPIDADKGAGKFHPGFIGEFFELLFGVRNKNFGGRRIQLFQGTPEYTEAEFVKIWEGKMVDVEFKDDTCIVSASTFDKDVRDGKVPNQISTSNTLQADITDSDVSLTVLNGTEFELYRKPAMMFLNGNQNSLDEIFSSEINEWDSEELFSSVSLGTVRGFTYRRDNDLFYFALTSGTRALYSFDRRTGIIAKIGNLTNVIRGLAWDETNQILYGSDGSNLYTINTVTGADTLVGSHTSHTGMRGLTWDKNTGVLLGVNRGGGLITLVSINTATGASTAIGNLGLGDFIVRGLTYNYIDDVLYTIDTTSENIVEVDRLTGVGTVLAPYGFADNALAYPEYFTLEHTAHLKIEDEYILFTEIDGNTISGLTRGELGTTAVAHLADEEITAVLALTDPTSTNAVRVGVNVVDTLLDLYYVIGKLPYAKIDWRGWFIERDDWVNGRLFSQVLETPRKLDKLIEQYLQFANGNAWTSENQLLVFRILHPIGPDETPIVFRRADNIVNVRPKKDMKNEEQITRVLIHYDPINWGTEDNRRIFQNYRGHFLWIDVNVEDETNYNKEKPYEIWADPIQTEAEAGITAGRIGRRFSESPAELEIITDLKETALITGGLFDYTGKEFLNEDGTERPTNMQVLSRKLFRDQGRILYTAKETRIIRKVGRIAHPGFLDWVPASDFERAHAYIGLGTNQNPTTGLFANAEMSDGSDGTYIY